MQTEQHIRIKNNLFLLEEGNLLCFQKTYGNGIEFPKHQISEIIITAFNTYSLYDDIINYVVSKTNWPKENVSTIVNKWFEMGLIENFAPNELVKERTDRYNRQLGFFDALSPLEDYNQNISRQEKLSNTHILIIGIGGIGNYAALSFTAMGIGKITLLDGDKVESSNLSRQIIFRDSSIAKLKTEVAAEQLKEINPTCSIRHYPIQIQTKTNLEEILKKNEPIDFIFVSADKPLLIPYWVDELSLQYGFSFINCSYQSYTGFIGPLITNKGKRYADVVKKESQLSTGQSPYVEQANKNFRHPSTSASNAILANMAVLESVKYILGLGNNMVLERRAVYNLNTFEIKYE